MKVAVIGGDTVVGRALAEVLRDRHPQVEVAVTPAVPDPDLLAGAAAVVDVGDATAVPRDQGIRETVLGATRAAVAAAETAGVGHVVFVSSAGLGRPSEDAHFAARLGAEVVVETSPVPRTIVRTTPLFEAVARLAQQGPHRDPVHGRLVIRPIAARDVAAEVAAIAVDPPRRAVVSLAGPDRVHLDELVERVRLARFHHREAWAVPHPAGVHAVPVPGG